MTKVIKILLITLVSIGIAVLIFYTYSLYGLFKEYDDAFLLIEGEEDIVLSQSEFEKTSRVLEKWQWGDKQNQEDENFRIISIDGYECVKVWTSMPTALLNSTHPLVQYVDGNLIYDSQNFSTYNCMKNLDLENFDGEFYLYGQPFFYDEQWWLYKPFEPRRKLIAFLCSDPCFTSWQNFAKPEPILKSDPIYLEK
tara:strand:- start:1159 stop:1746 length:588 start_codon:yes stop_codon:yes gene_type:complete